MWELIYKFSAISAFILLIIFFILLFDKSIYTKSGLKLMSGLLIFACFFGSVFYYVTQHKIEIEDHQYAKIYSIFVDESKDKIIKAEIRNGLADGMFSKEEYNSLHVNHLESLNYSGELKKFDSIMPNVALNYSSSLEKMSINISLSTVYLLRTVLIMSFIILAYFYASCWIQYNKAIKKKLESSFSCTVVEQWNFMQSKKSLIVVAAVLSFSLFGLILNEVYLNNITVYTKDILVEYGEANKYLPLISDTVKAALADDKVTVDEFSRIERLEKEVIIDYIKKAVLSNQT